MPKKKRPVKHYRATTKRTPASSASASSRRQAIANRFRRIMVRMKPGYLGRSHQSFRLTRRRDYVRHLAIPGYIALTVRALRVLGGRKRLFALLVVLNMLLIFLLASIASQEIYQQVGSVIDAGEDGFGPVWQAVTLAAASVTGSLNASTDPTQGFYAATIAVMTWLVTIWLVRSIMSGQRPRLRDGLYNAGAPIISTVLLVSLLIVQLVPVALAIIGYQAATASGLLTVGVEAMLFWIVAALMSALSLYWVTTTLLSLVVVTLPGMYPLVAHKNAFMLVSGRRVRIVLRWLWAAVLVVLGWFALLVPLILLERWLAGIYEVVSRVPVIPLTLLLLGAASIVFVATYAYVFYREIVDHDAAKK